MLATTLLLSACESISTSGDDEETVNVSQQDKDESQSAQAPEPAGEPERVSLQMTLCQKELEALQKVSPRQHQAYQREFSRLMHSTVQYAGVRTQVNSNTQETVDALYHYKAKRLCANISQVLLNGLAEIAESVK